MYGTLALSHRVLDDLSGAVGRGTIDELRALARPIEGLRVLNLSVTAFGTGTAELLNSSVPLLSDLGLECHWQVVRASEQASAASRAMYRALGGTLVDWTRDMTDAWLRDARMNAELLTEQFDVVVVHDPQPAAIRSFVADDYGAKWIFHSHLDLSAAQEDVWLQLRTHIERYDAAIFEAPAFLRPDLRLQTYVVPPAIDPTNARNMPLPEDVVRTVLERYGIDPDRPLICQVSPCDAESDLVGAVSSCAPLRDEFPGLQIAIILMTEPQDPAARMCYDELARRCADDPGLFVVGMGNEFGNVEMNVFQRAATVVIQKGLRKGFGLWVADALWKERPVVAGPVAGLMEQVIDGETGLIAGTPEAFTEAVRRVLDDRAYASRLGANGRQRVRERFLITRYLRDYLQILNEVQRAGKVAGLSPDHA